MRLCFFEDAGVPFLEPIILTRPAFSLWCGARPLWQRLLPCVEADGVGGWIRPLLLGLARQEFPDWQFNSPDWLRGDAVVYFNARWMPQLGFQVDTTTPHVGLVEDQVAYLVRPSSTPADFASVQGWLDQVRKEMPCRPAQGQVFDFLWNLVESNPEALVSDGDWFRQHRSLSRLLPANVNVSGSPDDFLVESSAVLEPFIHADTRGGPVMIDQGAVIHSFTRLEGPCYIGPDSVILGAKIRAGTTLGPQCRIGGEVEESIVQGYSNKYHEGFLGHSYIGEWVNLAAATQTSDLRNDYGIIHVTVNGQRLSTGRTKVGSFIGDHTKTGLGALLNTGSVIGPFCNVLPSGTLLPQVAPSFCQVQSNQVTERFDLRAIFQTAQTVMRRRGIELTEKHLDFFYNLFDATGDCRRRVLQELMVRKSRRSR